MVYEWQRWLADEFRAAGLTVIEVDGWRTRGRPESKGHFRPRGIIVDHHTGTTSSAERPAPSLTTLIQGRSDLPGPLCQYGIDYHGRVYVIAAGRANVNGKKRSVTGWPEADGNEQMGVEVMTNGTQRLPDAQRKAMALTNAVVMRHFGRTDVGRYVWRHEDISLSGKWDIGQLTTAQCRTDTAAALRSLQSPTPPTPPTPPAPPEPRRAPTMLVTKFGSTRHRLITGDRIIGISEADYKACKDAGIPAPTLSNATIERLETALVAEVDPDEPAEG